MVITRRLFGTLRMQSRVKLYANFTVPQKSVQMFRLFLYRANYPVNTKSNSMRLQPLDSQTSVLHNCQFVCLYTFHIRKYVGRKQGLYVNTCFANPLKCPL